MRIIWILCLLVWGGAGPLAANQDDVGRLVEVLKLSEVVEIMREEGIRSGADLGRDMLPGGGGAQWSAIVDRIYDLDAMMGVVQDRMSAALGKADLSEVLAHFSTQKAQSILDLENAARRTIVATDALEAAKALSLEAREEKTRLVVAIGKIIETNDYVEFNVSGYLNASFRFMVGMADGGALEMTQDEIIAETWSEEESVRQETEDWLFAFLGLAYEPLSDKDLADYGAIYETPTGQELNRALFDAFDHMYQNLSYALGLGLAAQMVAKEL